MLPVRQPSVETEDTGARAPIYITDASPTGTIDEIVLSFVTLPLSVLPNVSLSYTLGNDQDLDYEILRPIPVVVEQTDECFVASFVDANLHASGETVAEALDNLKSYIADVLAEFLEIGHERLGPGPSRELAVLEQYVRERNAE